MEEGRLCKQFASYDIYPFYSINNIRLVLISNGGKNPSQGFCWEEFQTTVNLMKIGLPVIIFIMVRAVLLPIYRVSMLLKLEQNPGFITV